ncbi:hypothetical protein Tco_0626551 [Tanacetum coccineum]|uniref:Uncharacterized protein n=1 Tax=Tanacetum coccineum TaxID=301880 RepID=A0ABQ4WK11_9ASTR
MTDHVCVHNSRSAEAKPVPVMDADGSGELRNSCSKFGRFFSVSSHSHLIPPIQCSVGCVFADCVADAFVGVDPRDVSVPVVEGQSVNGGGVTSADVYIGETDSAKPRESEQRYNFFNLSKATIVQLLLCARTEWRIEMTDHIQDKGYKGNFDLRLRVAGRGTQLLKMINGYGLRRFVASYNPDLLHMEGSKVFVSAAAGSVDTTIDLYWAAIKLPDSFTSGDVLAFYVPWTNERPLENKELNAIIGARFTLWRD